MIEGIGGGHVYTAEEVCQRLKRAKDDGDFIRDSNGMYHLRASSGSSGFSGSSSYYHHATNVIKTRHNVDTGITEVRLRFSLKRFLQETINEFKEYFTKKEKQHE